MTIKEPVRKLILKYMYSRGHSRSNAVEASSLFGCSVRSIWSIIRLRLETETSGWNIVYMRFFMSSCLTSRIIYADPLGTRQGRKNWVGIPTQELELLLIELQRDPSLFTCEMADFLFNAGYPAYSPSQIWRGLKSRNITRKVLEVHAREQNEQRRQEFLRLTKIYTAEQGLYVGGR